MSDVEYGAAWRLCGGEQVEHLLELLGVDSSRPGEDRPARKLLESFSSRAKTLVIEYDYFDIDFKSEYGKIQEDSFRSLPTTIDRFHFFDQTLPKRRRHLRDIVRTMQGTYLGYSIIRPKRPGLIGRTIVTSSFEHPLLAASDRLQYQVKTTAIEYVQVFGVRLRAIGVPFMEQDGHLLRCAHISAWICHYAAVLRGVVPRRTSAQFHGASDTKEAIGRPYPSSGISSMTLSSLLRAVDLSPELIDRDALREPRDPTWADQEHVRAAINNLPNRTRILPERQSWVDEFWIRLNLVDAISRYLNSAIPCIIADNYRGHTKVVVGYLRAEDLKSSPPSDTRSPLDTLTTIRTDVAALIVSDDREGPYEVELISDIAKAIHREEAQIFVPLPASLWLSGTAAEVAAIKWFEGAAVSRLDALDDWRKVPDEHRESYRKALSGFVAETSTEGESRLSIRTYVVPGKDFKESFSQRIEKLSGRSPRVVRDLCQMQLPKFVWISEVIDRSLNVRDHSTPAVLGTILFDATQVSAERNLDAGTADMLSADLLPLFMHIPGQAFAAPIDFDNDDFESSIEWFLAPKEPYASGRWRLDQHEISSPYRSAGHWKTATLRA